MARVAIVLSGGGARAAYQVGLRLIEIGEADARQYIDDLGRLVFG